jgi:hypothetical protein
MNLNNYATLEASQRLVSNGIVLETDAVWAWCDKNKSMKPYENPTLYLFSHIDSKVFDHWYSAPSMTEVWRELQKYIYPGNYKLKDKIWDALYRPKNNTTDALIELLIWVKAQKEGV